MKHYKEAISQKNEKSINKSNEVFVLKIEDVISKQKIEWFANKFNSLEIKNSNENIVKTKGLGVFATDGNTYACFSTNETKTVSKWMLKSFDNSTYIKYKRLQEDHNENNSYPIFVICLNNHDESSQIATLFNNCGLGITHMSLNDSYTFKLNKHLNKSQ
jgi:hypothetical protein